MIVKELLLKEKCLNTKIFQVPIYEIDTNPELVNRFTGEIVVALNSNQNYLNFNVLQHYHDNDYLVVICEANEQQRNHTISCHKNHKRVSLLIPSGYDDVITLTCMGGTMKNELNVKVCAFDISNVDDEELIVPINEIEENDD